MAQPAHTDVHHDVAHHEERPTGWRRWVYSTNHKDIGTMYLVFALIGGIVGGILSIAMRLELMSPGMQIFSDPEVFNVFVASHGLIMVFLDRKSTRLNSSHLGISYAVFCLKKKNKQ